MTIFDLSGALGATMRRYMGRGVGGSSVRRPSTWRVPSSIDSTGATDVVGDLETWLAGVPDGATIRFQPSGTYRLDTPLDITSRNGLVFDGEGTASIIQPDPGVTNSRPAIRVTGGEGITIARLSIDGGYTNPGVLDEAIQHNHGIMVLGATNVVIDDVTITNVSGDGVYLGINSTTICETVTVRNSTIDGTGRCGIAFVAGNNLSALNNDLDVTGYTMMNIEPNTANDHCTNILINGNTLRASSHAHNFSAVAPLINNATIDEVVFSNNTITGRTFKMQFAPTVSSNRFTNITISGNTCDTEYPGPDNTAPIGIDWCDGITITNNTIPTQLNSPGVAFWQSTDFTVSGNDFGSAYTPYVDNN